MTTSMLSRSRYHWTMIHSSNDIGIVTIDAIKNELSNLYNNKVMQFVSTIPDGTNVITTKWVFALKRNKFNKVIKYKARLVARGDKQIYGLDYEIVYSPTLGIACITPFN